MVLQFLVSKEKHFSQVKIVRILLVCNVPVSFTRIPLIALDHEPPRTKSFKTIEASVRVDAIASAGFKTKSFKTIEASVRVDAIASAGFKNNGGANEGSW
ncbi:hypothetical protein DVH24_004073 [Malus domestica]|uniref:Uncharacterized protein n=1 Tax=Malus domestica TaxID=3750 RepID=A0A498K7D5_MALDO|nr:hypothetical protein DVH24_004073 [Malus domestica]